MVVMGKKGLVKEAVTLLGGNMLAQLITLAAYFVLTRIYIPEDYGLFNIFYSYIEVLIIFSTCKYELAVVVAEDDGEASAVAHFALRMNTMVCIALLGITLVLWLTAALPGNLAALEWMVLLIPPLVYFCGTSRVYSFLYNRFHRYGQIALSDSVNAGTGAAAKILLGLLGVAPAGLPIGTVAGQAAANINYRLRLRSLGLPAADGKARKTAASKHRNFPLYVAPKDIMNTLSANLPFLWLAIYFERAEVGLFGLALTFTLQPVNILSAAFERVLYARGAEVVRKRQPLGRMTRRFVMTLLAVALPICVAAWFVAEPVFTFCFGDRWQGCGVYVQALLPWALLALCSTSLMFVANIFSTQRTEFFFYLVMLLLRIATIYTGIRTGSFLLSIRMYAIVSALTHAALVLWYLWQVQRYERSLRV